jgi:hypothetical protein
MAMPPVSLSVEGIERRLRVVEAVLSRRRYCNSAPSGALTRLARGVPRAQ